MNLQKNRPSDSRRCFRRRMGHSFKPHTDFRVLDSSQKRSLHQCERIEGDTFCLTNARSKCKRLEYQDVHGQHYRTQVSYKIRRNRFSLLARPSNTNSRNHQQIQHDGSLPTHSGHTEYPIRQTQSSENPSIRVESSQEQRLLLSQL